MESDRTQTTRTALERAEDAIARADCYPDFGLNACATEIAVEINEAVAAERDRCIARIKHWFGGDSIDDDGYECVREIENGV